MTCGDEQRVVPNSKKGSASRYSTSFPKRKQDGDTSPNYSSRKGLIHVSEK